MKEIISRDIKTAMKARDAAALSTLRMILSEFQYKEKEKGLVVDRETAHKLLQSMVRKRIEAAEQFRKGNRPELAEKELAEIKIIETYLPQQLSPEEIRAQAREVIAELGAGGPKDMGKVIGFLMKKLSGRADGGSVSRVVKEELMKMDG